MARRLLSQTLTRWSQASPPNLLSGKTPTHSLRCPSCRLLNLRSRSNRSEKAQLVEVDLEAESAGGEPEFRGMRRLEDAIHGIIVRRSAPDWLPFIPGSSYWVPPRRMPYGLVELFGRLAKPLSQEEVMSFSTIRGWPSSAFYIEGVSPHPIAKCPEKAAVQSDEEG